MKYRLLYFFFIVCLFNVVVSGCDNKGQNAKRNEANSKISKLTSKNKKLQDQNNELTLQQETLLINHKELQEWAKKLVDGYGPGIWYMDESTMPVFIKPVKSGDIKEIIRELNLKFKQDSLPLIALTKAKGTMAYVRVDDAALLTQRMGTHGSTSYINAVTYSLASVDHIDCVMFDFKEGDHAIPGKYCR
jgi:outer membrane murein-binding lipoprotein Lpp